jgi:transcriptional regulator with XRE-family HTH domain
VSGWRDAVVSRLQQARRARGWSQTQLIAELRRQAEAAGFHLPGEASLRTELSRWENGRPVADAMYRQLSRDVYNATDAELAHSSEDRTFCRQTLN